jgi:hydroxylaminobenzene mutase
MDHGKRLLQLGVLIFLLALVSGVFIPSLALPRVGVSTHLLGLLQGLYLMALGLIWPRLKLRPWLSRATLLGLGFATYAAWVTNLLAAIFGAGGALLPMAAGQTHGNPAIEMLVQAVLPVTAITLIASTAVVLWGLRGR